MKPGLTAFFVTFILPPCGMTEMPIFFVALLWYLSFLWIFRSTPWMLETLNLVKKSSWTSSLPWFQLHSLFTILKLLTTFLWCMKTIRTMTPAGVFWEGQSIEKSLQTFTTGIRKLETEWLWLWTHWLCHHPDMHGEWHWGHLEHVLGMLTHEASLLALWTHSSPQYTGSHSAKM